MCSPIVQLAPASTVRHSGTGVSARPDTAAELRQHVSGAGTHPHEPALALRGLDIRHAPSSARPPAAPAPARSAGRHRATRAGAAGRPACRNRPLRPGSGPRASRSSAPRPRPRRRCPAADRRSMSARHRASRTARAYRETRRPHDRSEPASPAADPHTATTPPAPGSERPTRHPPSAPPRACRGANPRPGHTPPGGSRARPSRGAPQRRRPAGRSGEQDPHRHHGHHGKRPPRQTTRATAGAGHGIISHRRPARYTVISIRTADRNHYWTCL